MPYLKLNLLFFFVIDVPWQFRQKLSGLLHVTRTFHSSVCAYSSQGLEKPHLDEGWAIRMPERYACSYSLYPLCPQWLFFLFVNNILFEKGHWTRLLLDVMETCCLGAWVLGLVLTLTKFFLFLGRGVSWNCAVRLRGKARRAGCDHCVSPGIFAQKSFSPVVTISLCFSFFSELTRFCSYPFGIQNGRVKNTQITASSMANKYHAPYFGRLKQVRRGRNMGGWSARYNNHNQWIQFDLRRLLKLTMVSTQGRKLAKQWVTRYTISTSIDCAHFVPYKQRGRLKVQANETALFLAKYMWVVRYSSPEQEL